MNGAIEEGFAAAVQALPGFGEVEVCLGCSSKAPDPEFVRADVICDDTQFIAGFMHSASVNFSLVTPAFIGAEEAEREHREMSKVLHDFLSNKQRVKAEFRSDTITMVGGNVSKAAQRRDDGVWIFEATITCTVMTSV